MATSGSRADLVMNCAPYCVRAYLNGINGRMYFDAHRFGLMQYSGDEHFVFDSQMQVERLTGVEVWARRWHHWGRSVSACSSAVVTFVDSPVRPLRRRVRLGSNNIQFV